MQWERERDLCLHDYEKVHWNYCYMVDTLYIIKRFSIKKGRLDWLYIYMYILRLGNLCTSNKLANYM